MPVETKTGQAKKKLVGAVKADLMEDATEALVTARDIFQALSLDAKGLDNGLVTACNGWSNQLDIMLDNVKKEVDAVAKRMGDNGKSPITVNVDHALASEVSEAREKVAEESSA